MDLLAADTAFKALGGLDGAPWRADSGRARSRSNILHTLTHAASYPIDVTWQARDVFPTGAISYIFTGRR